MKWPTPRANDAEKHGDFDADNPRNGLAGAVKKWPTPRASDGEKGGPNQRGSKGDLTLSSAVMRFPTPTATQHKGWSKNHNRADTDDRLDYTIEREAANCSEIGRLNPTWVEWLMGWPSEWTDLKPLAMDKYQEWQQQHGCF